MQTNSVSACHLGSSLASHAVVEAYTPSAIREAFRLTIGNASHSYSSIYLNFELGLSKLGPLPSKFSS